MDKMKTKRTLTLALALTIAMTLALAACGRKNQPGAAWPTATPDTPAADGADRDNYDEYDYDEYEETNAYTDENPSSPDTSAQYTGELYAAMLNGKWGYVNELDEVIFPFEYDEVNEFHDDRALVYNKTTREYGYIDKGNMFLGTTHTVLPLYTYTNATDFKGGLAAVHKDGKWGFIDTNGNEAVPFIYQAVGSLADNLIPAEMDGYWGFIDKQGNTVIDFIYTDIMHKESDGYMWYGVNVPNLDKSFTDGRIIVHINDAQGVIDTTGSYVIPLSNEHRIELISEGENQYIVVNKHGNLSGIDIYDWNGNNIKQDVSCIHTIFSDGALLVSCFSDSSRVSGLYSNVRYGCFIIDGISEINIDELIAEQLGVLLLPEDNSFIADQQYLYGVFGGNDYKTSNDVEWMPVCAYIAATGKGGLVQDKLWNVGLYYNGTNSKGSLLEADWAKDNKDIFYPLKENELSDKDKSRQEFADTLSSMFEISRFIQDNVAIITDQNKIFYGIATWRDGAVYIDYEPVYTKIQYDTKTNIFTLERGASTTVEVWAGPNGRCFAVDEMRIPASRFESAPDAQTGTSETIAASSYTGSFSLAGMWKTGDSIITFSDGGAVNALFFGFGGGGPDGSWTMSSKADENGHYTLSASHITGGSPVYKVRLIGKDEIELYGESGIDFGADYYHLYRQ
jgi:hypothetical protein